MAVKMAPIRMNMEAMMMRIMLQFADTKIPAMVIPDPDPSSLDSMRSRLITEPRPDPGLLVEDC